jgi:hypothetical protein
MRPPACVSCKWGTGTACEKPTNSVSRKEMEAKLKEMMAAREKQDAKWFAPSTMSNGHTAQSTFSSELPQNKRK